MKEQLLKTYQEKQYDFKIIRSQFPDDDMAGPFLMSLDVKYSEQKIRLLIVGQETHGWDYYIDDLKKQMEVYENFNVGQDYYASPFWNVTRKVEKALGINPHSCAWTNISKFDLNGGRAYGPYETAISKLDDILIVEIRIINPDVCIFFTGPSFDKRIENIFDSIEFEEIEGWTTKELCQLMHCQLPQYTLEHIIQTICEEVD